MPKKRNAATVISPSAWQQNENSHREEAERSMCSDANLAESGLEKTMAHTRQFELREDEFATSEVRRTGQLGVGRRIQIPEAVKSKRAAGRVSTSFKTSKTTQQSSKQPSAQPSIPQSTLNDG